MEQSNKFAWTWEIKEECLEEYVKMHLEPWDEIMEAHTKESSLLVIHSYSTKVIWLNGKKHFNINLK